jgi:hypothetical protein
MSQSINLRINVLLGDQAGPVRASIIQDELELPGKNLFYIDLKRSYLNQT